MVSPRTEPGTEQVQYVIRALYIFFFIIIGVADTPGKGGMGGWELIPILTQTLYRFYTRGGGLNMGEGKGGGLTLKHKKYTY